MNFVKCCCFDRIYWEHPGFKGLFRQLPIEVTRWLVGVLADWESLDHPAQKEEATAQEEEAQEEEQEEEHSHKTGDVANGVAKATVNVTTTMIS